MWIVIGVGAPVLILAILVATWPVVSRSVRYHRFEHRRAERRPGGRAVRSRVGCALCDAHFESASPGAAVAATNRHVTRVHNLTREAAESASTTLTSPAR